MNRLSFVSAALVLAVVGCSTAPSDKSAGSAKQAAAAPTTVAANDYLAAGTTCALRTG